MYTKEIFSQRLKKLRADSGNTMAQTAELLNVPLTTYNNWERGDREPPYKMLCAIAQLYHVSTDYLLGYLDER